MTRYRLPHGHTLSYTTTYTYSHPNLIAAKLAQPAIMGISTVLHKTAWYLLPFRVFLDFFYNNANIFIMEYYKSIAFFLGSGTVAGTVALTTTYGIPKLLEFADWSKNFTSSNYNTVKNFTSSNYDTITNNSFVHNILKNSEYFHTGNDFRHNYAWTDREPVFIESDKNFWNSPSSKQTFEDLLRDYGISDQSSIETVKILTVMYASITMIAIAPGFIMGAGKGTFHLIRGTSRAVKNVIENVFDFFPEKESTKLLKDEAARLWIYYGLLSEHSAILNQQRRMMLCRNCPDFMNMKVDTLEDFVKFRKIVAESNVGCKKDLIEERLWQLVAPHDGSTPTLEQIKERRDSVLSQLSSKNARRILKQLLPIFAEVEEGEDLIPFDPQAAADFVEKINRPFIVLERRAPIEPCPEVVVDYDLFEEPREEPLEQDEFFEAEEPPQEEQIEQDDENEFFEAQEPPHEEPLPPPHEEPLPPPHEDDIWRPGMSWAGRRMFQEQPEEPPQPPPQEAVIEPPQGAVVVDSWLKNTYEGVRKYTLKMTDSAIGSTIMSAIGILILSNLFALVAPDSINVLVRTISASLVAYQVYNSQYSALFFWIVSGVVIPRTLESFGISFSPPIISYSWLFLTKIATYELLNYKPKQISDALVSVSAYAVAFGSLVIRSPKTQKLLDIARSASKTVFSSLSQVFVWIANLVASLINEKTGMIAVFVSSLASIVYGMFGFMRVNKIVGTLFSDTASAGFQTASDFIESSSILKSAAEVAYDVAGPATKTTFNALGGMGTASIEACGNFGEYVGSFLATGQGPLTEPVIQTLNVLKDDSIVAQALALGKTVVEAVWTLTSQNLGPASLFLGLVVAFLAISLFRRKKDENNGKETRDVKEIDCLFQWIEISEERLEICRDWIAGQRSPNLEYLNEYDLGCLYRADVNLQKWIDILKSNGVLSALQFWRETLKQDELELRAWIKRREASLQSYLLTELVSGLANIKTGIDQLYTGITSGIVVES